MDTRHRLTLAATLAVLPVLPLAIRLTHLQVMLHERLDIKASGQFKRSSQEVLPRGTIIDRNGHVLAESIPSWGCVIDKTEMTSAEAVAARLSPALGVPQAEIIRKIKKGGRFVWLKKGMTFEEMSKLSLAIAPKNVPAKKGFKQSPAPKKLEGAAIISGQERIYPNDELARNIIGQVGADGRGMSGVELTMDGSLTGKSRKFEIIRDGSGHAIYKNAEGADDGGPSPLRLTIDRTIQFYSEEALAEAAAKFSIKSGIVAVQDPNNGEILALASYPANPLKNNAIQDTFEPGSTFKVVAAAAAIAESLVSDEDEFFCENGNYTIAPGVVIHDHEPKGALTLSGIMEHSSNIGIAKVVERIGAMNFYRYGRAFGFANKTGISLPGETAGSLKPVSDMTKVGLASASYGYGVGVSALQLLGAYSAIANGGTLWEPSIIKDGRKPERVRQVAPKKSIEALSNILETVVRSGTGAPAQIPGYKVAGKTGTARRFDAAAKQYSASKYTASFIGYVPADRPQLTILVVIDEPKGQYYGAQVSAPVFAKLGRNLLALKGIAPDPAAAPQPQAARSLMALRPRALTK